ncbi:efflux RND transporter periplasmic adaptor subunit [Spirulina major]|uniref:efflux RND transporter periplasmic adaptor subunit n=1 Tax=Spirulina major TaxID=270636 RepID=UPI000934C559|nr:efflux RND transporter periplasmic adaptor subunit [Spirulina major]
MSNANSSQISPIPPQRPNSKVRVMALVGATVLLTGVGVGWRWWSGQQQQQTAIGQPQSQALPVKLITLGPTMVANSTDFVGSLAAEQVVEVRPEATGRVQRIFVAAGDRVAAGARLVELKPDQAEANLASLLATVNSERAVENNVQSEIAALNADRIALKADVDLKMEDYKRIEFLVKEGVLSEQRLDQAKRDRDVAIATLAAIDERITAARATLTQAQANRQSAQANANRAQAQLEETVVTAPFAGVVGDLAVELGDVVTDSNTLTTLTQNNVLNLSISIPTERAPELQLGQLVELVTEQGNILNTGEISFIDPNVNPAQQTLLAKARFINPGELLRNGQFVRARLVWRTEPGLLVPTVAITRLAGKPFVFVAEVPTEEDEVPPDTEFIARQRPVELGQIQGDAYNILSGVQPGDRIVVSGILNLTDGAPIMPLPDDAPDAPDASFTAP